MYTADSRDRSPDRRRALIASVSILGLSTALAAALVSNRRAITLGGRIAPANWPVSFQPPTGWSEDRPDEDTIAFLDDHDRRNPRRFAIYLLPNPSGLSAAEIARQLMASRRRRLLALGPSAPPENAALGPLPGARVNMPQTGDYVHVGLLPPDEARAVVLQYHTAVAFTGRDVRVCRRIVESVKAAGDS